MVKDQVRIKSIINDPSLKEKLIQKGCNIDINQVLQQYNDYIELNKQYDNYRHEQKITKDINIGKELKNKLKIIQEEINILENTINNIMDYVPNIPHHSVPIGKDSTENVIVKTNGEIIYNIDHYNILGINPYTDSAGSRFMYLEKEYALLERALYNFMLDELYNNGFIEYSLPVLLKDYALTRSMPQGNLKICLKLKTINI
mgnify:FL=1